MYDPVVGRFLSEDPIGFDAGDANLSRYVSNQPTMAIDPFGLEQYTLPNIPADAFMLVIRLKYDDNTDEGQGTDKIAGNNSFKAACNYLEKTSTFTAAYKDRLIAIEVPSVTSDELGNNGFDTLKNSIAKAIADNKIQKVDRILIIGHGTDGSLLWPNGEGHLSIPEIELGLSYLTTDKAAVAKSTSLVNALTGHDAMRSLRAVDFEACFSHKVARRFAEQLKAGIDAGFDTAKKKTDPKVMVGGYGPGMAEFSDNPIKADAKTNTKKTYFFYEGLKLMTLTNNVDGSFGSKAVPAPK